MDEQNLNNGYVRTFDPRNPGSPYADIYWDRNKNPDTMVTGQGSQLKSSLAQSLQAFPQEFVRISPTRNTLFFFPSAATTPMTLGVAGSPPINAAIQPTAVGRFFTAGSQVNSNNNFGNNNA